MHFYDANSWTKYHKIKRRTIQRALMHAHTEWTSEHWTQEQRIKCQKLALFSLIMLIFRKEFALEHTNLSPVHLNWMVHRARKLNDSMIKYANGSENIAFRYKTFRYIATDIPTYCSMDLVKMYRLFFC